ncbi:retropepsin-like aspartic protease [Bacteroides helcogenes]|uniref:Peptidase A2 domain-containing protein n=1 Tax=Bacteroides helcogenes (strain ATCC 35417 / DSM 20613 / JCM 6297 / CCUG 15421 / P 36-108) TaxID=693979 RepID=E6SUF3_BACT6|nr:retropepsin-like aspartic protease [Bacteroides helcogenes]ADV42371.1 hypothetical protein Bache_0342 [Bacteroides helcogenes P 36-108]MDY5237173.1 retropepsin-like aspartic protease [Bacteroides helcogenes]
MGKIHSGIFVLLILALASGCGNKDVVTLSYEERGEGKHIYIPVTIGGEKYDFIFDTGSDGSVLDYPVAWKSGIRPTHKALQRSNYSLTKEFKDDVYFATKDIYIGKMKFDSVMLHLDHYNHSLIADFWGMDHDGILGTKEIESKNWLFDLESKTVTISNKPIRESRIKSPLALCLDVNPDYSNMNVDILLNDSLLKTFLFDTGYPGRVSVIFNDKAYPMRFGVSIADSLRSIVQTITPLDSIALLADRLKINNLSLDSLVILIADRYEEKIAPETSYKFLNFIGLSFLDYFRYMLYDSRARQIRFYGYHANNQGEKDFIKALKRKE